MNPTRARRQSGLGSILFRSLPNRLEELQSRPKDLMPTKVELTADKASSSPAAVLPCMHAGEVAWAPEHRTDPAITTEEMELASSRRLTARMRLSPVWWRRTPAWCDRSGVPGLITRSGPWRSSRAGCLLSFLDLANAGQAAGQRLGILLARGWRQAGPTRPQRPPEHRHRDTWNLT